MTQTPSFPALRLSPSSWRMFWPTVTLAAISFGLAFSVELVDPATYELALWVGAALAGLFWLLPYLNFLAASIRLDGNRLTIRSGFLGLRKQALDLMELSSIEVQSGRVFSGKQISILTIDGSELVIKGYARTKLLALEIEALARLAG